MEKIIYLCVFVALVAAYGWCPSVTVLDQIDAVHVPVLVTLWAILETFLAHYIAKILVCSPKDSEPDVIQIAAMFFGFTLSLYGGGFAFLVFILAMIVFIGLWRREVNLV